MKIEKFEDLRVWQRAQDLAVFLYERLEHCKDYKFKGQLTSACVAVSNNIAEGFDQPTTVNYIRFLHIARTSSSETRSMSYLAERLSYLLPSDALHLRTECIDHSKMLWAMIEKLEAKAEREGTKRPR